MQKQTEPSWLGLFLPWFRRSAFLDAERLGEHSTQSVERVILPTG